MIGACNTCRVSSHKLLGACAAQSTEEASLANEIVLSSTAAKAIASLAENERVVAKASLEKIAGYEIYNLINLKNVRSVAKEKNYYFFRASPNIRIFFQIENHSIIVLDFAHHKYAGISKTFLNLFIVSVIVSAVFMYFALSPGPTAIPTIAKVNRIQGSVQAGPESALEDVNPVRDMNNNDAVHVQDNGKANLDFGHGMVFTLYSDTTFEGTRVNTNETALEVTTRLSEGGLNGYNPPQSRTEVFLPNDAKIIILGTHYFITYNPKTDIAWVYNLDGTVQYALPGGPEQNLAQKSLVEFNRTQVIDIYDDLRFSTGDFDRYATQFNSPIQGVEELLKVAVAGLTSTATPSGTPTSTRMPTPYGTPPPTLTKTVTVAPSTYTPYPTYTLYPTSTPIRFGPDEVTKMGGWALGTVTSCLTSIIAFIGFFSTTVLAWKKEAREAQNTKLDYQKTMLELERMRMELETMTKQKAKIRKSRK